MFINPVLCFVQLSLSVTEEMHRITFQTQFDYQGLSIPLEVKHRFLIQNILSNV